MLFCFRRFYGEFIINGKENLPSDDSPIIFAPNHLNALMDALAVSSFMPPRKAVIYLARADFFAQKTIAKIMHFAKIMPAFRMRDGFENLEKNQRSFFECIQVMRFGHAVCIMPEGGQGEERKIRPLLKGIFRIAFEAQHEFGDEKKVKIIPIGIDLGDLNKCGKHIIINIGKPIEVSEYMEIFNENQPVAVNEIRDELKSRLSDLTLDMATSENYEDFETIAEIMAYEYEEGDKNENPTYEKFKLKQMAVKKLVEIENSNPELMAELVRLSDLYKTKLKKLRFKSNVFSRLKSDETSSARFFSLLLTFPVFLFGFITNALPTFVPVWVRKILSNGYSGFNSSIQFGLGLIFFPFFYIVQAILFDTLISPNWGITLFFVLMQFFTRPFALKWYSNFRKYLHKLHFNGLLVAKIEQSTLLYKLISVRNRIVYLLNTYH